MDFSSLFNKITDDMLEQIKKQNGYNADSKKCACPSCKELVQDAPKPHWLDKFKEEWNSYILILNDKSYFVQTHGYGELMKVGDDNKYSDLICFFSSKVEEIINDEDLDYCTYFYIPFLTVVSSEYSIIHLTKEQGKDIIRKIKEDIESNEE